MESCNEGEFIFFFNHNIDVLRKEIKKPSKKNIVFIEHLINTLEHIAILYYGITKNDKFTYWRSLIDFKDMKKYKEKKEKIYKLRLKDDEFTLILKLALNGEGNITK